MTDIQCSFVKFDIKNAFWYVLASILCEAQGLSILRIVCGFLEAGYSSRGQSRGARRNYADTKKSGTELGPGKLRALFVATHTGRIRLSNCCLRRYLSDSWNPNRRQGVDCHRQKPIHTQFAGGAAIVYIVGPESATFGLQFILRENVN